MEVEAEKEQQPSQSEADVERLVRERQRRRREQDPDGAGQEDRALPDVLKAAQRGEKLFEGEVKSALDWVMERQDSPSQGPVTKAFKLNLGTATAPQFVRWEVGPVEDNLISKIRKASTEGTKAQKRRHEAEVNEFKVATKMVTAGTIDPDVRVLANEMGTGPDPSDAVHAFFARAQKTGLIVQLSGEILNLSGYDEDDISEVDVALG